MVQGRLADQQLPAAATLQFPVGLGVRCRGCCAHGVPLAGVAAIAFICSPMSVTVEGGLREPFFQECCYLVLALLSARERSKLPIARAYASKQRTATRESVGKGPCLPLVGSAGGFGKTNVHV
jgi:hypothetical protein